MFVEVVRGYLETLPPENRRVGLPPCATRPSAGPLRCFTKIRRVAGQSKNSRANPASRARYLRHVSCASSAVRRCNISRDGACNSPRVCSLMGRTRSQRSGAMSATSPKQRSVGASSGSQVSRQPDGAPVDANSYPVFWSHLFEFTSARHLPLSHRRSPTSFARISALCPVLNL